MSFSILMVMRNSRKCGCMFFLFVLAESSFETLLWMTARLKLLRRALLDKYSTKINAQVKSESTGHMDEHGNISMVDVSNKEASVRSATAEAKVLVGETVSNKLTETTSWKQSGVLETTKGNLFTVAQIAGIQAAKRTSEWIPLCHPLSLQHVDIQLSLDREKHSITIRSTVKTKVTRIVICIKLKKQQ